MSVQPFWVWWVGLAAPAAMALLALVAFLRRHRLRGPLAGAALAAGLWNVVAWAILRRAMPRAGAFEAIFIQLSFSTVAAFFFVVAAMVLTWRQNRAV